MAVRQIPAPPIPALVLEIDAKPKPKPAPKPNTDKAARSDPPYRGARTALKAPTVEYLLSLRTEKEREFQDADVQIDDLRKVRTMNKKVVLPDHCQYVDVEVRDPTIADEVQRVVATLTLNDPKLSIKAPREGETAEKNATLRKDFTSECLLQAGRRLTGHNTLVQAVDACAGDGGAWTKFLFARDTYEQRYALRMDQFSDDPDSINVGERGQPVIKKGKSAATKFDEAVEDAKKEAGVPFVWTNVDVRTVYPVWSQGKLTEVLEVQMRPLHSALRQWRLELNAQGKLVPEGMGLPMNKIDAHKIPQTVKFLEHWDAVWVTYVIEGAYGDAQVVKQFRHRYGRVPYFPAFGFTFNWMTGIKAGWGVAQTKRWLVEYMSFLLTLHAQSAARDTFAPFYRTLDATKGPVPIMGKNGQPLASEKYQLGQIVNGPPGSTLQPFPFQESSAALKEQIAYVREMIDKLLTPRVNTEIGSGLEGAGFAMNQVISESRIMLDPIAQAIESMLEEITRFMWHLIRTRVREKVWVEKSGESAGWLGAGPDDLTAGVGIKWELDPERPSTQLVEERYWHERIAHGTASIEQAIRAMGDDPEEVRFQRDLEAMRQEPWYIQYRQEYLLKQIGRGDILAKAAAMAAATGQLPGVQGNPAVANAASGALAAAGPGIGGLANMTSLAVKPGANTMAQQAMSPGPAPVPTSGLGGAPPSNSAAAGLTRLAA